MIVTFLAFNLNGDVFSIHTPSFPQIEGNGNQLKMFSTKKLWKVTILWVGGWKTSFASTKRDSTLLQIFTILCYFCFRFICSFGCRIPAL